MQGSPVHSGIITTRPTLPSCLWHLSARVYYHAGHHRNSLPHKARQVDSSLIQLGSPRPLSKKKVTAYVHVRYASRGLRSMASKLEAFSRHH
jgi:hypothetical protein